MPQGYKNIQRLEPVQIAAQAGVTLATWVGPLAGELEKTLKYVSGTTVILMADNNGSTLSAAQLNTAFLAGNFYNLGTTEIFKTDGPVSFYLAATGTTGVITCVRGYGPTQQF